MDKIMVFRGKQAFLNNSYMSPIILEGISYYTVEHAYQASKTVDKSEKIKISKFQTVEEAQKFGDTLIKRPNWEEIKLPLMEQLLKQKFSKKPLSEFLKLTGQSEIINGNIEGDTYWGVCRGIGRNHLGNLLMKIRNSL